MINTVQRQVPFETRRRAICRGVWKWSCETRLAESHRMPHISLGRRMPLNPIETEVPFESASVWYYVRRVGERHSGGGEPRGWRHRSRGVCTEEVRSRQPRRPGGDKHLRSGMNASEQVTLEEVAPLIDGSGGLWGAGWRALWGAVRPPGETQPCWKTSSLSVENAGGIRWPSSGFCSGPAAEFSR